MSAVPPPGHPHAVADGCVCDPIVNVGGLGMSEINGVTWYRFRADCPLHGDGDWKGEKVFPPTVQQLGDPRGGGATWTLMPAAPGLCSQCGREHEPEQPHDRDSLRYAVVFAAEHDRPPTWADAMAHCDPELCAVWVRALRARGVDVGPVERIAVELGEDYAPPEADA